MNVSLSAVEAFLKCEQNYEYGWVRKLRPVVDDVAPQRGTLLHEYLQTYYDGLKAGDTAVHAHSAGLRQLETHAVELDLAASLSFQAGRLEEAAALQSLLADAHSLSSRYFNLHGRLDADRYEVLLVEQALHMPIVTGIISTGYCDLLLRDRVHGRIWLVEHKSTWSVPDTQVRLWNLQTLLYATKLYRTRGFKVDGILWNYIRTKPPAVPDLLKSAKRPALTRRQDLDTNWETYEDAIKLHGLDPREYVDVRERLLPREADVYFPRFEHVIVVDPEILLSDYAVTATRIRRARWEWEQGRTRPVRTLGRHCSWCRYSKLCEAALMGGDEEDLISRLFKVQERPPVAVEEVTP